ncbi:MAG TPA: alpha/beta hydrolase [Candidatus Sulfomarinibacteraceae bacterium]|nr:alpha/beta hydrolase [Candidatus Sulfomarinibacteraceae bacterium]
MTRSQSELGRRVTGRIWTVLLALVATTTCTPTSPPTEEDPAMTSTSRHFFASSLGAVHYVDAGPREGAPLVLLHQTPRSIDEYRDVIPVLAAERRVVAVDMPGYGCSDVPDHQPSVEEYADTVVALLDHLGIPEAVFVGHHTGAILSIDIAARHPRRVNRLVLSGPFYMDAEAREMLHGISEQWRVRPDGSHIREKWDKFSGWTDDPAIVQRVVTDLLRAGETSEYGHFACAEYRMEETLPLVEAPSLLIIGRSDQFANHPKNAIFADALPGVELAILDGGVFLPAESPGAFAEAVLAYLDGQG